MLIEVYECEEKDTVVGVLISVTAFIGEISMTALVVYAVGFMTTVFVLNTMIEER